MANDLAAKVELLQKHRAEAALLEIEIARDMGFELAPKKMAELKELARRAGGTATTQAPRTEITAEEYRKVWDLRARGMKPRFIQEETGLTLTRVNFILYSKDLRKRFGAPEPAPAAAEKAPEKTAASIMDGWSPGDHLNDEQKALIKRLHAAKKMPTEIQKETGVSRKTIYRVIKGEE